MKAFDVLSRDLILHKNYLLEASAGTGKTFSIQNIVVRLLIEAHPEHEDPYLINQILVVTFTKASTRDLKLRIRSNIENALKMIQGWLCNQTVEKTTPDYLVALFEKGKEAVERVKKRLQQALFIYDEAQIFTIHSFCARMLKNYALESYLSLQSNCHEDGLPSSVIMKVIRDFFRTHIKPEIYSKEQIAIILKEDPDHKALLRAIQSNHEIKKTPSFSELFSQFEKVVNELKNSFFLCPEKMLEDYIKQAESYKNYKFGETKSETLQKIQRFISLFEKKDLHFSDFNQLLSEGLTWVYSLDPKLLKNSVKSKPYLNYPKLYDELKNALLPILEEAKNKAVILSRMAHDCQLLLKKYQKEEEKLSPDDLLKQMNWALKQESFLKHIQDTYQVAIVDEFQDTDPIQWQIFKRLFLPEDKSWKGNLYLVGDPKQSIYSFRQADIYTYLDAAKSLGKDNCFSLNINYRSQPQLVCALNSLFDQKKVSHLIPLPKVSKNLEYRPVEFSKKDFPLVFNDKIGAIHFFICDRNEDKKISLEVSEKEVFFPFIASEIESLIKQGIFYKNVAVLVRDRYQALRLTQYFDALNIPYLNQRGTSLVQTNAFSSLIELFYAILHPHDLGAIKTALAGPLIGWKYETIKVEENVNKIIGKIQQLKRILLEEGFVSFYNRFLDSHWHDDEKNVLMHLLERTDGLDFYHDLRSLVDLIIENQFVEWHDHDGIIPFLDNLREWEMNEDERIKRLQDPEKNGVKILSLHVSKGLEFDVVFALGLVNHSNSNEELISIEEDGKVYLTPIFGNKSQYRNYYEETDAEKMRQLYVAMTRSKLRLYIPLSLSTFQEELQLGEASPLELYFARFEQENQDLESLYKQIKILDKTKIIEFLEKLGKECSITYSIHKKLEVNSHSFNSNLFLDNLRSPRKILVSEEKMIISSFSNLAATFNTESMNRNLDVPHNFENNEKTIHTLPSSMDTGIFLHKILERMPHSFFNSDINENTIEEYIRSHTQETCYQKWQTVLVDLLIKILITPLSTTDPLFYFSRLDPSKMYSEMPFLFSCNEDVKIEGLEQSNGFIKGVIDLIFYYRGKYFIIDWKTNWLGQNESSYTQDKLFEVMKEHQYHLQAAIYKEALRKYLKLVERGSFEECFGGIYYLFVRGMKPGSSSGIYYIR